MVRRAYRNNKGASLVEILIALALSAIVFTALIQSSLFAMNMNLINVLRDEAVSVAELRMSEAKNTEFAALVSDAATQPVLRDFRGIKNFQYDTRVTVNTLGTDNKQVNVSVQWNWRGKSYSHAITTVVGKR
jgi:type II secretory pathway pseudopilin PulG